jgi:hypothetical protein
LFLFGFCWFCWFLNLFRFVFCSDLKNVHTYKFV